MRSLVNPNVVARTVVLILAAALSAAAAPAAPSPAPAASSPADPAADPLPPSRWDLKPDAPPGVAQVLERMKNHRQREYDAQLRAVRAAGEDLAARKAGRVVRELKAPEGWRAVPKRTGGSDYAFKTPQIKGQMVVKAEAALEQARTRLAEVAHPEYLAKPVLFVGEIEEGAAGTVSFSVVHQISGTEAVVRIAPDAELGRPGATSFGKEVYLSDFPAREYAPGFVLRDWTIEVTGTKTYQSDNGRTKTAPLAKPLDWRKWVEVVRRP